MAQMGTDSAATLLRLAKLANHCKAMLKNGLLTPSEAVLEFKTYS